MLFPSLLGCKTWGVGGGGGEILSVCLTWLLHCSCECHDDSKVS